MKSIYVVFPKKEKVEVKEEAITLPGPGEVLCAAEKSLISIGTETRCLRGVFDPGSNWAEWVTYPFRPGYSMAGHVIQTGPGVTGLKEGDRITAWISHQQFFKIQSEAAYLLPKAVSNEEATWSTLACTTQLAVRRAELQLGETVGVVGLGILGQLVVQYLLLSGARKIIAIDPAPNRLAMATAHGATHTLALSVADAQEAIEEFTGGKMLDAIFDVTGNPAVLAPCIPLLRRLGRVILLGDTTTPGQQCLGPGLVSNSISILGIHGTMTPDHGTEFNPWTRQQIIELFHDYLGQERMRVSDLVTHRYSPLDAPRVYATLAHSHTEMMGIIFDWTLL